MTSQTKIPCVLMRGGTSKGTYFLASDLPADEAVRDDVLLSVIGSPDARQIDGVGGANPLTSKVAVVKRSARDGVDLDYLFVQVVVDEPRTSTLQNCGNILAGVGQFAVEQGLVTSGDSETTVTIFLENSESLADVTFPSQSGVPVYDGEARIDGVPGMSAPVLINFRDTEGSACGALLPTGKLIDMVRGVEVTCIDNGMPIVLMAASDFGITGYESREKLNGDSALKARIEAIRLDISHRMNLGDVKEKTVPKMTLVAPPRGGGTICTRSFIPHDCHSAIGVFAAVSVGTGSVIPGTVAHRLAAIPKGDAKLISVEHPTGEFSIEMEMEDLDGLPKIKRAALLRTARRLFEGNALIPSGVWDGSNPAAMDPAT